jgi:hypothetical protein
MTSTGSPFSQVGARVKYFKSIGAAATVEFTFVTNPSLTSVMTQAAFTAQVASAVNNSSGNATGMVYRDMGKTITVVGSNGVVVAVYNLVQRVNGLNTGENVPGVAKIAVQTYSDDTPGAVLVVRTG